MNIFQPRRLAGLISFTLFANKQPGLIVIFAVNT
jgi:hypothetical protein